MKKVLVFSYLQRHLKKMIPLIKVLEENKQIDLTVVLMTYEERKIAEEHKISYQMLDDFTNKRRTMDFDLGWGLAPLINSIRILQPDLFIAIEVNYILRNAIRYCKQVGISNLIIQHGAPNDFSLHAFVPFEGETFAAWGEFSKDYLIRHHVDPSKIVLTGGIPFDRTLGLGSDKSAIATTLNINSSKRWIVFATQPNGPGNRPGMEEIVWSIVETLESSLRHPDVQLIIQVHPHQDMGVIKKIAEIVPNHGAVITRFGDTEQLIASSDGLITYFSTTAIDAVILQKPLMLINLTDHHEFFPFVKMGVAQGVYNKEEISIALDNMLSGEPHSPINQIEAANYMNYLNDGKALQRVVELCYKKLNLHY